MRTIYRLQHRHNSTNSTNDRPRSPHYDKIALFYINIYKTDSTEQMRRLVIPLEHSNDTIRRRLASNNIHFRRPAQGPILTKRHRQERLQRTTARQHWRYQQWRRILFSDEISSVFRRHLAEYGEEEVMADVCVMERDTWGGQRIMVWGVIRINHKAGHVIFQNIGPGRGNGVTAMRYINQVLRLHIVPYFGRHQDHMFQQNNTHTTLPKSPESYHGLPSVRI